MTYRGCGELDVCENTVLILDRHLAQPTRLPTPKAKLKEKVKLKGMRGADHLYFSHAFLLASTFFIKLWRSFPTGEGLFCAR